MRSHEALKMVGTAVLTIAFAMPYVLGIWTMWGLFFVRLPLPIGIIVILGLVVAPYQLVRDILEARERDRQKAEEKQKNENLEI